MACYPWRGGKCGWIAGYRLCRVLRARCPVATTWSLSTHAGDLPSRRSACSGGWLVCWTPRSPMLPCPATRSWSTSSRRDGRLLENALKKSIRKQKTKTKKEEEVVEVTSAVIIDEKGVNLGTMSVPEARSLASGQGMELVLVQRPKGGQGAVMRFRTKRELYEQQRKKEEQEKREGKLLAAMKEIKLSTSIDEHDLEVKLSKIRSLLENQQLVEVHIQLPKKRNKNSMPEELQTTQRKLLDRAHRTVDDIAIKGAERHLPRMTLCSIFKPKSMT